MENWQGPEGATGADRCILSHISDNFIYEQGLPPLILRTTMGFGAFWGIALTHDVCDVCDDKKDCDGKTNDLEYPLLYNTRPCTVTAFWKVQYLGLY